MLITDPVNGQLDLAGLYVDSITLFQVVFIQYTKSGQHKRRLCKTNCQCKREYQRKPDSQHANIYLDGEYTVTNVDIPKQDNYACNAIHN